MFFIWFVDAWHLSLIIVPKSCYFAAISTDLERLRQLVSIFISFKALSIQPVVHSNSSLKAFLILFIAHSSSSSEALSILLVAHFPSKALLIGLVVIFFLLQSLVDSAITAFFLLKKTCWSDCYCIFSFQKSLSIQLLPHFPSKNLVNLAAHCILLSRPCWSHLLLAFFPRRPHWSHLLFAFSPWRSRWPYLSFIFLPEALSI